MAKLPHRERSLWHIGSGSDDWFLLPRGALRAGERPVVWSDEGVRSAVATWWLDGSARLQLTMVLLHFGTFEPSDEAAKRARLVQLLLGGTLVALRRPHEPLPQTVSEDEDDDGPNPPRPRPVETTWIEIELVTPTGEAVANRRVRIELPDGSTVERSTDAQGLCRADGIDPGTCRVTLLEVDRTAWRPA